MLNEMNFLYKRQMSELSMAEPSEKPFIIMSASLGWVIRNFFQTGVVHHILLHFNLVVLATKEIKECLHRHSYDQGITVIEIDVGIEPLMWRIFRQMKKKIYLEGRNSSTERIWEKYRPRPSYQKWGGKVIKALFRYDKRKILYKILDILDFYLNKDKRFTYIFKQYQPVFYFATHASMYFEECLLRNAYAEKTRLLYMILSWDHLSSKVILNGRFHSILVWNLVTKNEILHTYFFYQQEQIRVVGIPQYDIYAQNPNRSYEEWCIQYNLNPSYRTILFSTMPQIRHEQQHIILRQLLEEIKERKRLPFDLQVLIKCHPFDNYSVYEELLNDFHVGIHRTSLMPGENHINWMPSSTEIEASRDTLYFCSVNINIFSTVTIEAAYFDKPIIQIAYDPIPVQGRIPCREYYNWDHYRPIVEKNATILVYSFDELIEGLNFSLNNPEHLQAQRHDLVRTYIGQPVGESANCLAKTLIEIGNKLN